MTEAVRTFLAFLAVLSQVALGVLLMLALFRRPALAAVRDALHGAELWLAWLVAAVATAGSLYFSEVANYLPCELCWYQRIAMYPLVIVLAVAAVLRLRGVSLTVLPLVLVGAAFSVYHYQLEWFPEQKTICTQGIPCNVIWFRELGYVTIPLLALTAFALIAVLLAFDVFRRREGS